MPELLLELFSEEIPARMQIRAADDLKRLVAEKLAAAGLAFARAESFVTPRRLALVVEGLPDRQPDASEERRGPRLGAPDQAIAGFLKANNLATLDQCEKRDTGKGEFWFYTAHRAGRPTRDVLATVLSEAAAALPWPKSMRWGAGQMRWVRTLERVVCVFDGEVVGLTFANAVVTGNATTGHRFHAPAAFTVANFAEYRDKLRAAHVILDHAERRKIIRDQADALAAREGLTLKDDPGLLAEVAGLVEWPVPLIGAIDQAFMAVPPEVLTTAMRAHQRYFALLNADGGLAPRFIVVANIAAKDGGKAIVAGNERVLRARLADAKFFWDQDRKHSLESRVPALRDIVFHAKLGTLADKVARIQALAGELAPYIPGAQLDEVRSAATLSKADLTTGMVGEFPELQGIMGRYYAIDEGESASVAGAIAEHYAPQGPSDRCPTAPASVAVALADKIDTLVGFFAIGEKPTGSRDPFALRRAALGVIRLIVENKLRLPLREAFRKSYWSFSEAVAGFDAALEKGHRPKLVERELIEFFADRLKVHLREAGIRHDHVSAVFALAQEDDFVRLLARVDALRTFLASEDGANLLVAYNRATSIVRIEEKKDKTMHDGIVEAALVQQSEERDLLARLTELRTTFDRALAAERWAEAMGALAGLRRPVDAFFESVTVNCEDQALRANRLKLLSQIRTTMGAVADFSQIEG